MQTLSSYGMLTCHSFLGCDGSQDRNHAFVRSVDIEHLPAKCSECECECECVRVSVSASMKVSVSASVKVSAIASVKVSVQGAGGELRFTRRVVLFIDSRAIGIKTQN